MTGARRRSVRSALIWLALLVPLGSAASGAWVVEPGAAGPDRPRVGRSLFDQLFAHGADPVLPFPFPALLARLASRIAPSPAAGAALPAALIPYGRSPHRALGGPDYLRSPRIVVAVDRGPPDQDLQPIWLKDRLFLGYQPQADLIEVISYNPRAARFEFQVVSGYNARGQTKVRYANRKLCTACHQNGAPIFAGDSWDETNANPRLEALLSQRSDRFHGVSVHGGQVAAAAIDNATDRANLLAVYQAAWKHGCGSEPGAAARCRGALVLAMLQARMGPFASFSRASTLYRSYYLPQARRAWSERWPGGMLIPNPNLPNRDPLATARPVLIPAALDALTRRPPVMVWPVAQGVNRVIIGMAESLPDRDLRRIDRHLVKRAAARHLQSAIYAGPCRAAPRGRLSCRLRSRGGRELAVALRVDGAGSLARVDRIVGPDGTTFYAVSVHPMGAADPRPSGHPRVSLTQTGRGLSLRTSNGGRLAALELTRDAGAYSARLSVTQDFRPLETLIREMADAPARGSNGHALTAAVFDGPRLTSALLAGLGETPTPWCCAATPPLPRGEPAGARRAPDLLSSYCADCHRRPGVHPPGFLARAGARGGDDLTGCAPYMLARLRQWELAPEHRATSPMPPWTALRARGIEPAAWIRHPDYARLLAIAESLVAAGPPPDGHPCGR